MNSDNWGGEAHRITFSPASTGEGDPLTEFLRWWEGLPGGKPALKAYKDPGGVLTIGYGHTGRDIGIDSTVTPDEAEELLHGDIVVRRQQVSEALVVAVTQCQMDALTSFCFNLGIGSLRASTLLRNVNHNLPGLAGPLFDSWVYADINGVAVRVDGLVRRRAAERAMFERGDYSWRP